jgi:hypothetical protein
VIKQILLCAVVVVSLGSLTGCGNSDTAEAEKPAGTTAPINNNAPEAKAAAGAPAPDSGMPPPGLPNKGVKR